MVSPTKNAPTPSQAVATAANNNADDGLAAGRSRRNRKPSEKAKEMEVTNSTMTTSTNNNSSLPSPVNMGERPFTQSDNPRTNEIREAARGVLAANQQNNTINSLDNEIASTESNNNNDTPDTTETVEEDMPPLNNNDDDDNTPTNARTASAMSVGIPGDTERGNVDVLTTARKSDAICRREGTSPPYYCSYVV